MVKSTLVQDCRTQEEQDAFDLMVFGESGERAEVIRAVENAWSRIPPPLRPMIRAQIVAMLQAVVDENTIDGFLASCSLLLKTTDLGK